MFLLTAKDSKPISRFVAIEMIYRLVLKLLKGGRLVI